MVGCVVLSQGPEDTLRAYVRAFETLEAEAVLPFYDSPCMFIAPFGVSLAGDGDAARHIAAALMEHARSQGYRRTEIRSLRVEGLAGNLAMLTGVFVRFDSKDAEVGRFGFTYILREGGAGWRIVVAVGHDGARSTLRLDIECSIWLASKTRRAHLTKVIAMPTVPRVGEYLKFRNAEQGDYFGWRVSQVTYRETGEIEVWTELLDDVDGRGYSFDEESELDEYFASYIEEGWVCERGIRPNTRVKAPGV